MEFFLPSRGITLALEFFCLFFSVVLFAVLFNLLVVSTVSKFPGCIFKCARIFLPQLVFGKCGSSFMVIAYRLALEKGVLIPDSGWVACMLRAKDAACGTGPWLSAVAKGPAPSGFVCVDGLSPGHAAAMVLQLQQGSGFAEPQLGDRQSAGRPWGFLQDLDVTSDAGAFAWEPELLWRPSEAHPVWRPWG